MIFEPERVKGFQDILPPESQKRSMIRSMIEKQFALYGFVPIETPIIEYDELMRSDTLDKEDDAVSDRFRLKDKGARNLGLRYEFTFQLARLFKQNPNFKLPFKRYQIGPVFRDEPVSSNRFRQFTQCDIDIIGVASTKADAECIAAFSGILKELAIKADVVVNNRKLVNAILESVKITQRAEVMRELDKLDKLDKDTVKANLRKYADVNQILTLFKLLEKDLAFFIDNLFDGAEEIEQLQKDCKSYGVKVVFNPTMIRGLGYYTGNIFEVRLAGKKESIAGGGRYDRTVGKYLGREIPAVGFSFGLDRVASLATVTPSTVRVALISIKQDAATIKLAQKLRKKNISCVSLFKKPSAAMDYANTQGIPYAVFIGDDEIKSKKYKLKMLESGDEKAMTEKQLITKLQK